MHDDEARRQRQESVDFARGSVRLEGHIVSVEDEVLSAQYVVGTITADEMVALVLKQYQKEK